VYASTARAGAAGTDGEGDCGGGALTIASPE
jgi:hypothetical protein